MSNKIPQAFIDEMLQRTAIVSVISAYVKLQAFGHNYKANCPFHHEKTPSFSVNPTKQFYHCFGCGASGNAITFVMQYKQVDFREAVAYLAQDCGMPMPSLTQEAPEKKARFDAAYSLCQAVANQYQQAFSREPVAQEYMKKRGIEREILSQFQIGYSTDSWDTIVKALPQQQAMLAELGIITKGKKQQYYDRFRNRIMFPIQNEKGAYVGFGARTITDEMPKYLNSSDAFIFKKGFELYGLYQALQSKKRLEHLIVVEGYMDVIGLHNNQVKNVVASLGTAITKQQIQKILRYCDKITFCFDGDNAGTKAAWKALLTAIPLMHKGAFVKFVFLPEGEDPDSFIQQHGKAAFAEFFSHAQDLPDYFFTTMQAQYPGADISSKAQFVSACVEVIDTVPQSIFRSLLEERLQQLSGIAVHKHPPKSSPAPVVARRPSKRLNTLSRLIGICIQHPAVLSHIRTSLPDENAIQALSPTLLDLCVWGAENPSGTTGQLLEHFRHHKHSERISMLAAQDLLLAEESYIDESMALLNRLRSQTQQQQIDRLLSKSKSASLSAEEKQELQQLLTQQKMPE